MRLIYDVAIIGSGGAAFAAAIRASKLGFRCAVIERDVIGGTCVNVGCIPSKALLAAADVYHRAASHPFAGVATSAGPVNLEALVGQKDELIGRLRQTKYVDLADSYGFELVHGEARFLDDETLAVNGEPLRAGAYIAATGAEPAVPDLPGLADGPFLTSTTAMALTEVPERLVVIGGGFVGMEQGQLFARLGSKVTIVGRLAPRAEPELADWMRRIFTDDGMKVVPRRAVAVERGTQTFVVTDDGGRHPADAVLVAVGRSPRVDGLDLEAADIKQDAHGFITISDEQQTTNARVFAAGDVAGGPQFVYTAAAQGAAAAENALTAAGRTVDYAGLPSVIFTSPSLASAGMTEAEVLAAGQRCDCRVVQLEDVPRALVNRDTRGAVKVVIDARSRKVLGVHAVAEGVGEMMLAATYAIKFGLTVEQLADTWAPYLTMSEALKLTAQSFKTDIKKLSCCAA
jgi:mercuric reductase